MEMWQRSTSSFRMGQSFAYKMRHGILSDAVPLCVVYYRSLLFSVLRIASVFFMPSVSFVCACQPRERSLALSNT